MADNMRLIILSGLSGSGKTVALHVLEDLGYYCVDNMPAALLGAVVEEVRSGSDQPVALMALGVDARNRAADLHSLPELIRDLQASGVQTDLLFLHASDEVLMKRYSESRRRHPLAEHGKARDVYEQPGLAGEPRAGKHLAPGEARHEVLLVPGDVPQ